MWHDLCYCSCTWFPCLSSSWNPFRWTAIRAVHNLPWLSERSPYYMACPAAFEIPTERVLGPHSWSPTTSWTLHHQAAEAPTACPTTTCSATTLWAHQTYQHSTAAHQPATANHCPPTCRKRWICLVAPRKWSCSSRPSLCCFWDGLSSVVHTGITHFHWFSEHYVRADFQFGYTRSSRRQTVHSLDWDAVLWWAARRSRAWPHRHFGGCLHAHAWRHPCLV